MAVKSERQTVEFLIYGNSLFTATNAGRHDVTRIGATRRLLRRVFRKI
jgi:hypothetical protein